ncbi:MAG: ribonuclease III [Patescibacteria group bacterium]
MNIEKLEKQLNINFKDKDLLKTAFVHRSYLNEQKDTSLSSNERLEFLGDAVLELLTSQKLFHKYPQKPEGDLTNIRAAIVCTESLAETAESINLGEYLFLSKGEEETGGRERPYILANTFEALLGAIYLDQGLDTCEQFLEENLFPKLENIVKNQLYKDAKSTLQEIAQEKTGITPTYKVLNSWGPDHDKNFEMGVFLDKKQIGKGVGNSKQTGEQAAARNALKNID